MTVYTVFAVLTAILLAGSLKQENPRGQFAPLLHFGGDMNMIHRICLLIANSKIFQPIVKFVPVQVTDNLSPVQGAPQVLCHYQTMFQNVVERSVPTKRLFLIGKRPFCYGAVSSDKSETVTTFRQLRNRHGDHASAASATGGALNGSCKTISGNCLAAYNTIPRFHEEPLNAERPLGGDLAYQGRDTTKRTLCNYT